MSLRGVIISALLVFVAVAWWGGRGAGDMPATRAAMTTIAPGVPRAARDGLLEVASDARGVDERAGAPQMESAAEANFAIYVAGKYRFLFAESGLAEDAAAKLRIALLARERVAVAINTAKQSSDDAAKHAIPEQQAELDALDQKVGALLRPGDLETFEVLKNSDVEQFQLDDYAGGVSAIAPLSDADKKAILYTKLVHRQRFRQVLAESRLMRGDLSASERRYAFIEVSRALGEARDHYLQEARQYLYNDEQFTLLRNYENSEYDAELAKLRGIADGE
jgi:hypothetical protein